MGLRSVADVLAANGQRAPGFDWMRLALASAIVVLHCYFVVHGSDADVYASPYWGPIVLSFVPMFFAISGFLVTGSASNRSRGRTTRQALSVFLRHRALRILPALAASILLVTFVIGPSVTTLPLTSYFTSPLLYRYYLTLTGILPQYELPGVFVDNPNSQVNITIWTLRPEFISYALVGTIPIFFRARARMASLVCLVVLTIGVQIGSSVFGVGNQVHYGAPAVVYAFGVAATASIWADKVPVDWRLCVGALAIYWLCAGHPHLLVVAVAAISYVTIYLGMLPGPDWRHHDLSYGTYIYGFPIQQTIQHVVQATSMLTLTIALPVTLLVAALSWYLIERPATQGSSPKRLKLVRTTS